MSLNKTLDRLFDEIRREAKRNPDFADRLDAVLRLHESRRDVPDDVVETIASDASPASSTGKRKGKAPAAVVQSAPQPPADIAPPIGPAIDLNPVGLFKRSGEDALTEALAALDGVALKALIVEHNLDPAGETGAMDDAELAAHVVTQAKRRAARDEKMFDY
ncbi:MAG: hypothetical protein AB7P07_07150 [Hyphomonadaceae bacterium]